MKKPRILVVGSFVMDLTAEMPRFPQAGETLLGTSFSTASGGKGVNQAVQAARLKADVTMVGKVGMDSFGSEMIESCKEAGVHTEHILRSDEASSGIGHVQITSILHRDTDIFPSWNRSRAWFMRTACSW